MLIYHAIIWILSFVVFYFICRFIIRTSKKEALLVPFLFSFIFSPFFLGIFVLIYEPEDVVSYSELSLEKLPGDTKFIQETNEGYLLFGKNEQDLTSNYMVLDYGNAELFHHSKQPKVIVKRIMFSSYFPTKIALQDTISYKVYIEQEK